LDYFTRMEKKPTSRAKPLGFPVEMVLDAKPLKAASGPVYRAVITICGLFWAGGAELEKFTPARAAQLAKLGGSTWAPIKAEVMAALDEILPRLATAHAGAAAQKAAIREMLRESGRKGRVIMQQRRAAKREAAKNETATPPNYLTGNADAATTLPRLPAVTPHKYPEGKLSGRNFKAKNSQGAWLQDK